MEGLQKALEHFFQGALLSPKITDQLTLIEFHQCKIARHHE